MLKALENLNIVKDFPDQKKNLVLAIEEAIECILESDKRVLMKEYADLYVCLTIVAAQVEGMVVTYPDFYTTPKDEGIIDLIKFSGKNTILGLIGKMLTKAYRFGWNHKHPEGSPDGISRTMVERINYQINLLSQCINYYWGIDSGGYIVDEGDFVYTDHKAEKIPTSRQYNDLVLSKASGVVTCKDLFEKRIPVKLTRLLHYYNWAESDSYDFDDKWNVDKLQNIKIGGVKPQDRPDFSDAFIESAQWKEDGSPLGEDELEKMTENNREYINKRLNEMNP